MSKYSLLLNGKVLDYRFKKRTDDYLFYCGHILIGTVVQMRAGTWSAVSQYKPLSFVARGFKTRSDACEFLLDWNRESLKEGEYLNDVEV